MLYTNFYNVHYLFLSEHMHSLTFSISTSNIGTCKLIMDLLIRNNYLEIPDVNDVKNWLKNTGCPGFSVSRQSIILYFLLVTFLAISALFWQWYVVIMFELFPLTFFQHTPL